MIRKTVCMFAVAISFEFVSQAAAQTLPALSYDEFAQLSAAARDARFAGLTPEDKARLLRTRLERWLQNNHTQLSNTQIAAVRDAIDFVTPELYRPPVDPQLQGRHAAITERLACSLGSELAYSIGSSEAPAKMLERTWTQAVQTWIEWVVECVAK